MHNPHHEGNNDYSIFSTSVGVGGHLIMIMSRSSFFDIASIDLKYKTMDINDAIIDWILTCYQNFGVRGLKKGSTLSY